MAHISNNSGNQEWYTPVEYINSAFKVMGSIDLDPASSVLAQQTVQAKDFYCVETNGLKQKWVGNIWLNPPYARGLIDKFINKLEEQVDLGYTQSYIVLTNNATETKWGQKLIKMSDSICFPSYRIRFLRPEGKKGSPLQAQMFCYRGLSKDSFRQEFIKYGVILEC